MLTMKCGLCGVLVWMVFASTAMAEDINFDYIFDIHPHHLELEHVACKLDGLKNIKLSDGKSWNPELTLDAERAVEGTIVLFTILPLEVVSAENATVIVEPGWGGWLGDHRYGVMLKVLKPGHVIVKFRSVKPSSVLVPTTEADLEKFSRDQINRPSKFPYNQHEFLQWRKDYRKKLAAILMKGDTPKRVPLNVEEQSEDALRHEKFPKEFPNYTLRYYKYQVREGWSDYFLLAMPKGAKKVPLIVATHGHEAYWGKADPEMFTMLNHSDHFCSYFAERGWAVLAPATLEHYIKDDRVTSHGQNVLNVMRAIDYASTLPQIDMNRVAVIGLSSGGQVAMNVLALDDRVKAGVVGGCLDSWKHYKDRIWIPGNCICGLEYQVAPYIDMCDWAALAAPKPVQYHHGRLDVWLGPRNSSDFSVTREYLASNRGFMPLAEYEIMFYEILRAYTILGAQDEVNTLFHAGGHEVVNEAAMQWLTKCLKVCPNDNNK